MAKRKLKKKKTAGKVIMGLSVSLILVGLAAGGMYALDKTQVSASQKQEEGGEVSEGTSSVEDLENKVAELEATKTELQNKIASLTADKTALEATITENEAVIGSLNNQIETLDKEITTLRAEKLSLESANETNLEAIAGLNASIEALENERAALQIELDLKEETLSSLQAEVESLRQQIAELSRGSYSIKLENESLNLTYSDFQSLSRYSSIDWLVGNVSSTLGDETVPYSYSISDMDYQTNTAKILFYNGTAENGDYAVMILNIDENRSEYIVKYNDSIVSENYIFLNVGDTISLSDFQLEKNTYLFDRTATVKNVQISTGNGWHYLTDGDYTFSEEKDYTVWVMNEYNQQTQIYVSTTASIMKKTDSITYNSGEWDNNGNYTLNITMGEETGTITIMNEYFRYFSLDKTNFIGDYVVPGENWSGGQGYNSGGLGTVSTIIMDSNGNRFDVTFYEGKLSELHDYYMTNFADTTDLGIVVTNVEYFENGKGFTDIPEVTNIYSEGNYAIFEFNAFDQIGNKLYLEIGSSGTGYIELASGDTQTAVMNIVGQTDNGGLIISVGYALPGTQLYITVNPAE